MQMKVRQYLVVGRKLPSDKVPNPPIFKLRVFARNNVLAKTKFWYFCRRQHKIRKAQGEVMAVSEIVERKVSSVRNYGLVIRYQSRTGTHNMYREYRDVSLNGAVAQMYTEMAGRHRAAEDSIHVLKTSVVKTPDLRRPKAITFAKCMRYPKISTRPRAPTRSLDSLTKAARPNLFPQ